MIDGYLCVALDHGPSFDKWLTLWGAPLDERVVAKRSLLALALEARVDAVIVGSDLAMSLDAIASQARGRQMELWFGLPDQVVASGGQLNGWVPEAAAWTAAAAGATGIKLGVSTAADASWDQTADRIAAVAETVASLGVNLAVEPYFAPEDGAGTRLNFLRRLSTMPGLRFAKLDLHEPTTWSPVYGDAGIPWVARSEGLTYDAYSGRIVDATSHGCIGAMVGGAIWGIEAPLLSQQFVLEFERRIFGVRRALSLAAPRCA